MRPSQFAPPLCSGLGLVGALWWTADGPVGPWLCAGFVLFVVLLATLGAGKLLPRHPVGGGLLLELYGGLPSAVALVLTLIFTRVILTYDVASLSARNATIFSLAIGAGGVGIAAFFTAFDPVAGVFPKRLTKAFAQIPGNGPCFDDARDAVAVTSYARRDSRNTSVDGWGWQARRERMRQIKRALKSQRAAKAL